jgi:DNA ligase-associated metallophosphoesterase
MPTAGANKTDGAALAGAAAAELAGEELRLLPDGAAWWSARRTLLVADVHLGKAAAFRAAGVPVPEAATRKDLGRLAALVRATGAERLVVLGDLLHAKTSRQPAVLEAMERWRAAHRALSIVLVRGNHDRSAGDPPESFAVECVDEGYADGPFIYRHEPVAADATPGGAAALFGHVHPVVRIVERSNRWSAGRSGVRLKAFVAGERTLLFPAFGTFTGGAVVRPEPTDRVYVLVDERVMELPRPAANGRAAG